jgi:hypothetical protein
MTPLEIIHQAQAASLIDQDGHVVLELLPGLSDTELQDFADRVPCRVPPEIAELLGACSGFYGTLEQVDFTGRDLMFGFEEVFPYGLRSRQMAMATSGSSICIPLPRRGVRSISRATTRP